MDSRKNRRRRVSLGKLFIGIGLLVSVAISRLGAEIVITGNDWDQHAELNNAAGTQPVAIVTTEDDRKSLHLTRPSGDKSAVFVIMVDQLPAGKTRFAVEIISRQVQDSSNGCTIRSSAASGARPPGFSEIPGI